MKKQCGMARTGMTAVAMEELPTEDQEPDTGEIAEESTQIEVDLIGEADHRCRLKSKPDSAVINVEVFIISQMNIQSMRIMKKIRKQKNMMSYYINLTC